MKIQMLIIALYVVLVDRVDCDWLKKLLHIPRHSIYMGAEIIAAPQFSFLTTFCIEIYYMFKMQLTQIELQHTQISNI